MENEADYYSSVNVLTDLNLFRNLLVTDNMHVLDYLLDKHIEEGIKVSLRDRQVVNYFTFQTNEDDYFFSTTMNSLEKFNTVTRQLYRLIVNTPLTSKDLLSSKEKFISEEQLRTFSWKYCIFTFFDLLMNISSDEFNNFASIFNTNYICGTDSVLSDLIKQIEKDRVFKILQVIF